VVYAGPADDVIRSGGVVFGGPGDDDIEARPWVRSRIAGGPGDDTITGSLRRDLIDPGPGMDTVSTIPDPDFDSSFTHHGHDIVRTRDGEIDTVYCLEERMTALIDGADLYPVACRVVRRGAARAVPTDFINYLSYRTAEVWVECPPDGPRVCVGSVTASARGVTLRRRFRVRRDNPDFRKTGFIVIPATARELRRLVGAVRVTVRSRTRAGRMETVSGVFREIELD
jgi:hypothetical protein